MKISSRKNVYESIDILSQEMARQYFKDNHDKLSKEVELELETAKSKKEQKDIDESNYELLLKSFRADKENSNKSLTLKDKNNEIRSNKSSKTVTFYKDIKSQIPFPSNFKKIDLNEIYKNNANLRSSSKSQSRKDLGKIKLTHSVSPNAIKPFKKPSQINFKTNSNIKSLNDNSTLKTSLFNSSYANKNNDNEKKSIRSVNMNHTPDKKSEIPKFDKKNEITNAKTYNINGHFSNKKININANNNLLNENNNNHIDKSNTVQDNYNNKIKNNYTNNTNKNNDPRKSRGSSGGIISNNFNEKNKSRSSINIINKTIFIDFENRNKSNKSLKSVKSSNKSFNSRNNSSRSLNIIDSSCNSSDTNSNIKSKSGISNQLIKELSKDDESSDFSNLKSENLNKKNNVSINKEKSNFQSEDSNSNNLRISSLSSSLSKENNSLQKISLKNIVIYRKKNKTPKEFYQHQIFLLKRQKNIINSKKKKLLAKEEKDFTFFPEINSLSEQIIIEKGGYTPLFKRAAELQNMKNSRIILNEKKKIQEIDEMIRRNNTFYVNQNLINEFYLTQIDWKNSIQKRNKELYAKKEEEKINEEMKIKSYKIKMNKKSIKLAKNRLKQYYTINNISNSQSKKKEDKNKKSNQNQKHKSKYSSFERLYKDGQMKEKRRNDLIKSYLSTLFKPNINQSFTMSTMSRTKINLSKMRDNKKEKLVKNNKKMNNISKNLAKKSFSVIFEEINMPTKKASRNIKNNSINNNIGSTKSTRGSYNNMKNVNSLGVDSLSGKILNTPVKDINPLPYKLGEIKEMDSAICESSARNHEENKNKNKNINNKLGNEIIIKESNLSEDSNFVSEQKKEKEKEKEKQLKKNEREIIKKDIPVLLPVKRKSTAFKPYIFKEEDKNINLDINQRRNQSRKNMINVNIDLKKKPSASIFQKRESKNNVIMKTTQKNSSKKNTPKITPKITPKNTSKNTPRNSNKNTPKITGNNNKETKKVKSKMNSIKDNKLNEILSSNSKLLLVTNEANDNNNNLLIENSLLNESGSFGLLQQSNILETLSNKDKKTKRRNASKENNDFNTNTEEEKEESYKEDNEKENEEGNIEESSSSSKGRKRKKKKKKKTFKFNAYNNDNENIENLSYSFDEISSLKEDDSWIKKIGMIEMKQYKEKKENEKKIENINKNNNIFSNIYKNINYNNNEDDKNDKINLFMLNFRDVTSNAIKEPFIFNDKKGIFFKFFKKKA